MNTESMKKAMNRMTRYSIIIAVRKINSYLRESIEHIKKLNYRQFEAIIVLDDQEDTGFVVDGRFKFCTSGPVGPGEKRNIGAKFADGEILVFLDDDAYPSADWLNQADKVFAEIDTYALGGPALTPPNASFWEKMSGLVLESWLSSGGTEYRHIPLFQRPIDDYPTVNLFVKKDAFIAVGGFNTEFWPGEDTKLCLDLVTKYGSKFIYDPRPVVFHHRRTLLMPHLKQISRYGRHRGQFARIFPENSRTLNYFIPSLFIIGLLVGPFTYFLNLWLLLLYMSALILYMILLTVAALIAGIKSKSIMAIPSVFFGILFTHLVYGTNFIIGFIKRPELKLKSVDKTTGNYSEG